MSRRSWIIMAVLAATWGASYLFIKIGLRDFSAPVLVFLRTLLAALVLLPVALHRDALKHLEGRWRHVWINAVIQVAIPFVLITESEHHISSAMAGILVASAPIFTVLLAIRMDQSERAHGTALAGVLVGIVGVGLLFGVDLSGDTMALVGGGMVVLATLGYSIGPLLMKRNLQGADPSGVAFGTMAVASLLTLPWALATAPDSAGADAIGATLALGVIGTGVAFLAFYTLIAEVGPRRASIVAYLAPGFAVAYGVTLLGESITVGTVAGLALILLGSYLGAEGKPPTGLLTRIAPSRWTSRAPARAR